MNPILIVEDEKDIAELVEYHLKQSGFPVTAVLDGASALEKVKKDRPILIILDLMLPDMDGKDICRALKSDPHTRIDSHPHADRQSGRDGPDCWI